MMPRPDVFDKLLLPVHGRVDRPTQRCLRLLERRRQRSEADRANNEHVDIAPGVLLAACDRTVDEGAADIRGQGLQRTTEHVGQAHGLHQETAQLRQERGVRLDGVIHAIAVPRTSEDTGTRQRREVPLQA